MANFSSTLKHRWVTLSTAREVIQFSFIVRNSISYLNLELCQYSIFLNNWPSDYSALKQYSFINTEEKCRKFLTESRSLLYTLHLDLPQGRESSLKSVPNSIKSAYDACIPHIAKLIPACDSPTYLPNFVDDIIGINRETLKILARILRTSHCDMPLLQFLDIETVNKFLDCFYPEITDPAIFKDFIMQFEFSEWMNEYEKPEILEFLLNHARLYGRGDMAEEDYPIDQMIDFCILNRRLLNIGPILKYVNAPRFSGPSYYAYLEQFSYMRPNLTKDVLKKVAKWKKRERFHQMLQIIWIYIDCRQHHPTEDASEALRLIWNSVPDAYISFKEIKSAFGKVLSADELKNVYEFYARAVGECYESVDPRPLQHLCRTVIRRTLRENEIWIPEGLRKTGLPKPLRSFLNLEKVFSTSTEFGF